MVVVNYCGSQHCDGHSTVSYCRSFGSGVQGSFCFLLPLGFVWFGGACAVCGVCVGRYYTDFNSIVGDERRIWGPVCFGLRSGWLRLLIEIVLIALISHKKDLL